MGRVPDIRPVACLFLWKRNRQQRNLLSGGLRWLHLFACTGQAAQPSAFAPALFLSVPTELEPYSRLNRTTCGSSQIVRFSTSRQGTPHCVSGERCFFVIRGCGLRRPFLCSESQDFNRDTYPERCQTFLDTKEDTRIFPTNEPVDFFPAAPSGSRNLPLPMVGAH